jgi:hypothetical protein
LKVSARRDRPQEVLKTLSKLNGGTRADVRIEYEKIVPIPTKMKRARKEVVHIDKNHLHVDPQFPPILQKK